MAAVLASCSGGEAPPEPTLSSIEISPASATIQAAATQQFSATGHYSDGSSASVTVSWSATGGTVSASGLYTAGSVPGTFQVVATEQGGSISGAAPVTVTAVPPVLTSITVSPATISLAPTAAQQFVATGHYSGGGTGSVAINWTATGGTISSTGLFTAGSVVGPYQVTATETGGSIFGTAAVTITPAPPTLTSITVAPPTVTLIPAATQQFTASAHYSDNSTGTIPVDWAATGGTVSGSGLYTAGATDGSYQVTATATGKTVSGSASVTIATPPPNLVSIEVTPAGARIKRNESPFTIQYSAVGHLDNGGRQPVAVTWSTTFVPSTVAENTISTGGLFTPGYPIGPYVVTATLQGGSLSGTASGNVHATTGATVQGPLFWAPVAGSVYMCTSNHYTDDGDGLGGVATITAAEGVVAPTISYTNIGAPLIFGDGSGAVKVICTEVWHAPSGLPGTVQVTIDVVSNRPGTGMAKIFVYSNPCLTSDCRAGFTSQQGFDPNWTTAPVSQTVTVSATTGANIWFKNTQVP